MSFAVSSILKMITEQLQLYPPLFALIRSHSMSAWSSSVLINYHSEIREKVIITR